MTALCLRALVQAVGSCTASGAPWLSVLPTFRGGVWEQEQPLDIFVLSDSITIDFKKHLKLTFKNQSVLITAKCKYFEGHFDAGFSI